MQSAVRELRRQRGLSQLELAQRAGIHPSELSHYENGQRPSAARAERIAGALGVSVSVAFPGGRPDHWAEAQRRRVTEGATA